MVSMTGVEVAPGVDDADHGPTDELLDPPAVLEHPGAATEGERTLSEPPVAPKLRGLLALGLNHSVSPEVDGSTNVLRRHWPPARTASA